jgi:hypothetical protein
MHHFRNDTHKQKISYDNFKSAQLDCNKFNSKIDNLGKKKRVAYRCKVCDKVHVGSDYKKIITFKIQEEAMNKVNEIINNSILVKRIVL